MAGFVSTLAGEARGQIVINEFQYDDVGTDDREFVELFNSGPVPVDIGNWQLRSNDPLGANPTQTIPAGTMLSSGGFWVFGNIDVLNANQELPANSLENEVESLELYDAANALRDAVIYEANKGASTVAGFADIQAQVGGGYWPNHQAVDANLSPPLVPTVSVGRHFDGRDSNNNGRDFSLKKATPGAPNNPDGVITQYTPPNVDAVPDGELVAGFAGSFVSARAFTPGIADLNLNPNVIPAPPGSSKAIIAWDNAGGGNGVISTAAFDSGGRFDLQFYLDTTDLPATSPRSAEQTFFGIGGGDALTNLADLSGMVFSGGTTATANGISGIAWYYEKVAESFDGAGDRSEKLYLVDADDGGEANINNAGFDWTTLAVFDLAQTPSGWYELSLAVSPDGAISARFANQTRNFPAGTTRSGLTGEFHVDYRENVPGIPDYLRPATFAAIPEPGAGVFCLLAGMGGVGRRRRRFISPCKNIL